MLAKSCIRFKKFYTPFDEINKRANWLYMCASNEEGKFEVEEKNSASCLFTRNTYIFNYQDTQEVKFEKMFSIVFWAKCPKKALIDKNTLTVIFDSANIISVDLSSVDLTVWHQYSIVRDENNDITVRVDGTVLHTDNNTSILNLTNGSYIYFGSINPNSTGYDVILDDILLFDGSLDFSTVSNNYLDTQNYKKCLYIETSTGKVWGYKKD